MKICTNCENKKDISSFYTDKRRSDGLKSWCKECHNAKVREWQTKNREKDLANKRRYIAQRRKDPRYYGAERRAWLRWREENLQYDSERVRSWQRNNPTKVQEIDARRRARKKAVMIGDPQETIKYATTLRNDPCSYCGGKTTAIDHIVPLVKTGTHTWDNLTATCTSCNSSKGSKSLLVWLVNR